MIHTSVEVLDRHSAANILATMKNNRPVSEAWVRHLADAMKRGEWRLNGQPIIVASDGTGIDGQHRCAAIVRSGVSVPMLVVRGVDRESFATIDQGKKRSMGDVLAIRGEKNCALLSAIARGILEVYQWQTGAGGKTRYTLSQISESLDSHPLCRKWAANIAGHGVKNFTPGIVGSVMVIAEGLHGEMADEFFSAYKTGEGLFKGSPILALRERLLNRGRGVHFTAQSTAAITIKCWNAFATGRKVSALKWSDKEQFPSIQ